MRRFTLLIVLLLPTAALALMPPHTDNVSPSNGAELKSRLIRLSGYTLESIEEMAKMTGPKGEVVPFTAQMKCSWETRGGPWDPKTPMPPGAQQHHCAGTLTLTGPLVPGQTVSMELFGNTTTWTVPKAGLPKSPK